MFKQIVVLATLAIISTSAAPKPGVLAAAPLVAAAPAIVPVGVTATSSQVFHRNFNALAAPLVAAPAPLAVAPAAPLVAPAPVFASGRLLASPYVSPYAASPYAAYSPYFRAPAAAYANYVL